MRGAELCRLSERLAPSREAGDEQMRRGARQALCLSAPLRASSIFLGASGDGCEREWLMGCLAAGAVSAAHQRAALLAVADKLCESNQLGQAVPLLFLAGRGDDACVRLQRAGQWAQAATLAKASLPPKERGAVLSRWAEHLHARGETGRAIEILISLGRVQEVTERLLEGGEYETAALLLRALREAHEARRGGAERFAFRGAARVLLEYAGFLSRLDLAELSSTYCELATETSDSVGGDEALSRSEAGSLAAQLARLQQRKEELDYSTPDPAASPG